MPSRKCFAAFLLASGAFFIVMPSAYAQSQRLGLPVGQFEIPAEGKATRRGYCMDYGVPAPKPNSSLSHVLTDVTQISVAVGNRQPITIGEALKNGTIKIEARSQFEGKTVGQLANDESVPLDIRSTLKLQELLRPEFYEQLKHALPSDAPAIVAKYVERQEVGRELPNYLTEFAERLAGGDGENVVFVNLTNLPIRVDIRSPAVFSEHLKAVDDIIPDIPEPTNNDIHKSNQRMIWLDNAAVHAARSQLTVDDYFAAADKRDAVQTFFRQGDETMVLGRVSVTDMDYSQELRILKGSKITEVVRGNEVHRRFSDRLNEHVARISDKAFQFMRIDLVAHQETDMTAIQIGEISTMVQTAQLNSFLAGADPPPSLRKAIDSIPDGTNIVVWRDPVLRTLGIQSQQKSSTLVRRLHDSFGSRINCYLDDYTDIVKERVLSIEDVRKPSDLVLLSDKRSFEIEDYGVVERVEDTFVENGIAVYRDMSQDRINSELSLLSPNVIVLTGHKDEQLRSYIDALVATGVVEGRIVALFSCYAEGDEAFNSALLRSDRAPKAIVYIQDILDPAAVEAVLVSLSNELGEEDMEPAKLRRLLDRSIEKALSDPDTIDDFRPEIEKLKRAIIQVSDAGIGKSILAVQTLS